MPVPYPDPSLPATVAPCGAYYDCIPAAVEFLEDRIPKLEARLADPNADRDSREYRFAVTYLPIWKQRYAALKRDLDAIRKEIG